MSIVLPPFEPPLYARSGNAQTLIAALLARRPRICYQRERWHTPDGDFIDVDWLRGPPQAPLLVLFHGLESGADGHYALALAAQVRMRGWSMVVPHFRGCGGDLNWQPRAYHAGDSAEIAWVLARLAAETPVPLYAVGVSLGGNMLLKYLGEKGRDAPLRGAAAVCAPMDLRAAGLALQQGFNRLYTYHFLRSLKRQSWRRLRRFPGLYDGQRLRRVRSIRDFDDLVTGPLHGFAGVEDYWRRASSKPYLTRIRVPTLILNARDDPFIPADSLAQADQVAESVCLDYQAHGGHVGFVQGPFPGRLDWLPRHLLAYFDALDRVSAKAGR